MWLTLLTPMALASDGFAPARETSDCRIEMRDESHPEGAAMRATCHWPEHDAETASALLSDLDRYEELIWPIAESRVERTDDSRQLVFQRQHIWGMTDRVVLLWVTVESEAAETTIAWSAATEEPLAVDKGTIRTPKNSGYWSIAPHASGSGVHVVHEIAIQAGGPRLPRWLLNMIRTRGFLSVMKEVREHVGQQSAKTSP